MNRLGPTPSTRARRPLRLSGAFAALALTAGCSAATASDPAAETDATTDTEAAADADTDPEPPAGDDAISDPTAASSFASGTEGAVGPLDSAEVHTIDIQMDDAEFAGMVEEYLATGEKEWIEVTVTIDGQTFEQTGLRLKGNSSLRGVSTDSDPESLPWLIRLDKFVDGQTLDGLTDLVVRSNNSSTALNEAVALELLSLAGLASQDAIGAAFTVNDAEPIYRLVIEHPDDVWMTEEFDDSGALYKAESTGDYSYRGDDPDSYDEVFDQEAGDDNADLDPLIDFLAFINESDEATFAAELGDWLDVDAFATYLAMQELIDNFDDIDGPGNNSYLHYDTDTEQFTVVAWDHNLAFGGLAGGGPFDAGGRGGPGGRPDGDVALPPEGAPQLGDGGELPTPPDGVPEFDTADGVPQRPDDIAGGFPAGGGAPGGGGPGGSNVLAERFLADSTWAELVDQRIEELRTSLYDSGAAQDVLDAWSTVVADSGLVTDADIAEQAAQVADRF